jgi:hypothetical protein
MADPLERCFYVYIHYRKTDNVPFYVGKGMGPRLTAFHGRNQYWHRVATKYGVIPEILWDNLTEEESFAYEIDAIKELRSLGYPLTNITTGGDGIRGIPCTPERRLKMSLAQKGRVKSAQERENISKAQKGRKFSEEHLRKMSLCQLGKKQSEETRKKRSLSLLALKICRDKNIYVFLNILTNATFIGTRRELATFTGLHPKKFNTLFQRIPQKSAKGWRVLSIHNK